MSKKSKSTEFATVSLLHKTVVLMKDPAEPTAEMSAPTPNADTMFWARCIADGQPEVVTRNAEDVRNFVGEDAGSLDHEQAQNLAIVICYLMKLGDTVGGPFGTPKRIGETFRVNIESVLPSLVGDRLTFFANVLSPDDLWGVLYEYEYDLRTGSIRQGTTILPDP
jgi:hypothetical protein